MPAFTTKEESGASPGPAPEHAPRLQRRQRRRNLTVMGSLVVLLTGFGSLAALPRLLENGEPEGVPPLVVPVISIELEPGYTIEREFAGMVEPARRSRLSFERAGKVIAVHVDEGQLVSEGRELATLDTEQLHAEREVLMARLAADRATLRELVQGPREEDIEAARADVQRLDAQVRRDTLEAQRARRNTGSGAFSSEERDRRVIAQAISEAQLRAARANLDKLINGTRPEQIDAQKALVARTEAEIHSIEVDLKKSVLEAPFVGVVGRRSVDEGQVLRAGEEVVELLEMGRLEARIGVAGHETQEIQVGQELSIRLRGTTVRGTVKAIRPDRNSSTRAVSVLIELPEAPPGTRAGDVAILPIGRTMPESGVWLPVGAITEGVRGLWVCYAAEPLTEPTLAGATHLLVRRDVEVLHQVGSRVFVRGSLESGDVIVTGGMHRLTDGLQVRIEGTHTGGR